MRSLGRGSYSEPMVPGSKGSVGPGASRPPSGGCSVSPGCPLLRSSRSIRAIRSWSCSSEASRSCWSESSCWSSGSNVFSPSFRFLPQSTPPPRVRRIGFSLIGLGASWLIAQAPAPLVGLGSPRHSREWAEGTCCELRVDGVLGSSLPGRLTSI